MNDSQQPGPAASDGLRADDLALFRTLADVVPQILWITDGEGRVVFFNAQWRAYTGIEYDHDNAAEVAADTVHPDDVAETMARFQRAQQTGGMFEVEHRIRAASGDYRWFLVRARPYRDPASGAIVRWFGASVDIHDRRQTELVLQGLSRHQSFQLALADRLRPLADAAEIVQAASALLGEKLEADRVFYGETDPAGEYFEPIHDWTSARLPSVAGRRIRVSDFGSALVREIHAGRPVVVGDVLEHAVTAAHAATFLNQGVRAFMCIPLVKDGRTRATLNVHRAQAGAWTALDVALAQEMVDRTWAALERARALDKLRRERDRSRAVLDGMSEGFALLAPDWTVLEANEAGLRIAHRASAEVIGKPYWDIWDAAGVTAGEQRYRQVMASRRPDTWEYLQPFTDASAAWIEVRAFPVGARDLAVFFRDVSERKQAEQSLMDADRRKDEFLAMLAHELRNPLAPIGAAAHLLQMGNQDVERVRSTSQIIARQVAHMTHLIDDLLDVSRVTRGLVELERETLDVRRIVAEAVEQVSPLIEARRHQLALHMPTDAITVPGDRKRLVQVLANILNNAAKYTGEGGAIDLHVSPRKGHVLFEVSDNGIGMTRDLAAHAFDLFAQAERSADRSGGGLGLGLALVKNLVELHGGTVSCRSAGLGPGSTFCVCLPRIDAAVAADNDAIRGPIGAAATPRRVMIVDDNADAGHMLAMLLEAVGHEVTVADSAHAALALAAAAPAQVYLIDIGLPGMDGNELARQLRARPGNGGATLIAVTGYGQDSDRSRSFAAGFHHHLVKPVDLQALTDLLASPAPAR